MTRTAPLLSAAVLALPTAAFAQTSPAVGELVVTASRLPIEAALTPYSTQVIGAGALAGRESLADALLDVADIYVQAPGGRSGNASVFLRGSDPNFTVVALDGVALNNPTNTRGGSVNVSEISALGLERVEVVAGPLSSLYGSGALSGVINLVVPGGAAEHRLGGALGLGTEEDHAAMLQWRGPLAAGYGASLTLNTEDAGETAPSSSFSASSITGKLAPLDDPNAGRIVFRWAETEATAFPDSSGGPRLATLRELDRRESREGLLGVSHRLFEQNGWRFDLSGSVLKREDRTTTPGVAPSDYDFMGLPSGGDNSRYWRGEAQATAGIDRGAWTAVVGVQAQKEEGRSRGELVYFGFPMETSFEQERWTRSAFAEAAASFTNLVVNLGARLDSVDGLDDETTARLGVRYGLGGGLSLRASAGGGFKAPSFYALGNPLVGNPDLAPEESRSAEVGLEWAGAGGERVWLTGFQSRYTDLIDFVFEPYPHLANRSSVGAEGVSAGAEATVGALEGQAQVQYVETEDRQTGQRLLNRPNWRTSARLSWAPVAGLILTGRHQYVGERLAYSVPTGPVSLSGYHGVSLEAAWNHRDMATVRLIVDNALDDNGEDDVGFPAPGRRARILLSRAF